VLKTILSFIYYAIAVWFPTQPEPLWQFGCRLRRTLVLDIAVNSSAAVAAKRNIYSGGGRGIRVGNCAQLGHICRIGCDVTICDDVVKSPDAIVGAAQAFENPTLSINQQGALQVWPASLAGMSGMEFK
jgi:hypothetical protein